MELEVKEGLSLEDGKHSGRIERIEYREPPEHPYRYTDIFIKEDESGLELKYGVPTSESINSKLMKLLSKFTPIEAGKKVNPETILKEKDVVFMTMQEVTEKGKFVRIVDDSIKPTSEAGKTISKEDIFADTPQ